jgi:isocitrate dehydrogenase
MRIDSHATLNETGRRLDCEQVNNRIEYREGTWVVPDEPTIPYIRGDGIGDDITPPVLRVVDHAVRLEFGGARAIRWLEVVAGEKAMRETGDLLPETTLEAIRTHRICLKGPLTTPVGGGFRSINVTLRQVLGLYACVRPVFHVPGVPSPVKAPDDLDVVIFRENLEDVYAGIEFEANSRDADHIIAVLEAMGKTVLPGSAVGIKPMSRERTEQLVRMALRHAVDCGSSVVTLVHKGNIQKFTEGAFKTWGFELARREFGDKVVFEADCPEGVPPAHRILVNDRIADAMFQQLLLRPREYQILATSNLNGDYLSDAAAAQVGGLGMAPGANIGDGYAVFEATHGSAPKHAGQDKANPGSLLLSACMMLEHIGWTGASVRIRTALGATVQQGKVTYDLARLMGVPPVRTSVFADALIANL